MDDSANSQIVDRGRKKREVVVVLQGLRTQPAGDLMSAYQTSCETVMDKTVPQQEKVEDIC